MRMYPAVIEQCLQAGSFLGITPSFLGAYSQGETNRTLRGVIAMLPEDGEHMLESEFVGIQNVTIA